MTLEEFFAVVDKIQPNENGCMIWQHRKSSKGYAYPRINGKGKRGHRLSLERKLGRPLKEGMNALHKCDVPSCVNPSHLWEGTQLENIEDRDKKGRHTPLKGKKHGMFGKFGVLSPVSRPVVELATQEKFVSVDAAAKFYNLLPASVTKVCQGKINHTGGHKFSYLEERTKIHG